MTNSDPPTIEVNGENPICVTFISPIDSSTASALITLLSEVVNEGHDEVHLFLSSPGGTVQDGIAIYNFIMSLPVPCVTYNIGQVNSIGNVVYQAGQKKISSTTSSFMFHGAGYDVHNMRIQQKELMEIADALGNDQDLISNILIKHTRLSLEEVDALFLEETWIKAELASERGITDKVTEIHLPKGIEIRSLVFSESA
ncbi:MAG: hypothetical protein F4058_06585 [Rhodothermaceae bacterium]|nr:hypothetical protein [Rhodothermaceae bacterium]MYF64042.1 hypothetical protein [Rhodothermaceae bacterium]MYI84989.1 hypothetical protein [Rhodothermaceae bacterium]